MKAIITVAATILVVMAAVTIIMANKQPQKDTPMKPANINNIKTEKAAFAAGCFWHVEDSFRQIPGVLSVTSGYAGGHLDNPTYKDVCSGKTGHAESVEIVYDPNKVSYDKLLDAFWDMHDPTTKNRQGPDVGSQYRSVIFYYSDAQRQSAEKSKELQQSHYSKPIVTEIMQASKFWPAEEYHQRYLEKHGRSVCPIPVRK